MLRDKLVLVVEDNAALGLGVTTVLRRDGGAAKVELVAGYGRAVQRLAQAPAPGLVVTDYQLIDSRTGVDLAIWMRAQPALATTPCVLYCSTDLSTVRSGLAACIDRAPELVGMTLESLFTRVVQKQPARGPSALLEALQGTAPQTSG